MSFRGLPQRTEESYLITHGSGAGRPPCKVALLVFWALKEANAALVRPLFAGFGFGSLATELNLLYFTTFLTLCLPRVHPVFVPVCIRRSSAKIFFLTWFCTKTTKPHPHLSPQTQSFLLCFLVSLSLHHPKILSCLSRFAPVGVYSFQKATGTDSTRQQVATAPETEFAGRGAPHSSSSTTTRPIRIRWPQLSLAKNEFPVFITFGFGEKQRRDKLMSRE